MNARASAEEPAVDDAASAPKADPAEDLATYAELVVELAAASADSATRAAALSARGLAEAEWDRIDDTWQERFSKAADDADDDSEVPPLLAAYAEAFARAERARVPAHVIPFEKFVTALRWIQQTGDTLKAVERAQITLAQFLQANQHWTAKIAGDADLAERMRKMLG